MQKRVYPKRPHGLHQAYFYAGPVKVNWYKLREEGRKKLSSEAQLKLEWMIFYHTAGKENATVTARHFGVTRKTFHKWLRRFNKEHFTGLEEESRAPQTTRKRDISFIQRTRVKQLRVTYPRYGKMKLISIYAEVYGETISSWKIQKIIEEGNLYFDKVTIQTRRRRNNRGRSRMKITKLVKENKVNFLWHVDTVIFTLKGGGYRYLLTAIDDVSKLAYARLYTTHTSRNAKDFLKRLHYVTDQKILNIHHDNGSEFLKEFQEACEELSIPQWFSRPHTPKDNAILERFNRTIQEEFVSMTEADLLFVEDFNQALTEWLIEYNYHRPHKALDYLSPLKYLDTYYSTTVSPIYSSLTHYCYYLGVLI